MSAYVVEDQTINAVITYFGHGRDWECIRETIKEETGCDLTTLAGREKLGSAMFDLNCNAVEQRYGEGQAKEFRELNYHFALFPNCGMYGVYKSLGCWIYQCSEGDVPETSLLFATMRRVYDELAHHIVTRSAEYEKAKGW